MKRTLLFLSLLLLNASYLFAGTTGKIAGTTTDATTGDPLPFVNVIIMDIQLEPSQNRSESSLHLNSTIQRNISI